MKDFLKLIILSLLSITIFFVCVELIARIVFVNQGKTLYLKKDELFVTDKILGYRLKPFFNISGKSNKLYPEVSLKINSQGFRMDEFDKREKIAVFGDSVVFGFGISSEDTISSKLEQLLEKKYQVINAGVPGYNTEQIKSSCEILKNKIRLKKVIILVNANDFQTRYYPICGGATLTRSKSFPWENDLIDESKIEQSKEHTLFSSIILRNLFQKKSIYTSLSKSNFSKTDNVEILYKNVLQIIQYYNNSSIEVNQLKKKSISLLTEIIQSFESIEVPVTTLFFPFRISACQQDIGKDQRFEDIACELKQNTKTDIIYLKNILANSSDWLPSDDHPSVIGTEKIANSICKSILNKKIDQ